MLTSQVVNDADRLHQLLVFLTLMDIKKAADIFTNQKNNNLMPIKWKENKIWRSRSIYNMDPL